ncbi:sugar transferase [Streptomyces sp. NPDC008141]|uniref:sugar transferase n=1 Tax=Streptomyces sp. NPDC008141 TaxID=3364815 RepID=UPI0036E5FF3F
MEEHNSWGINSIPSQTFRVILSEEFDLEGDLMISDYMTEVDSASHEVVTREKTEDLLLRIKVEAFKQAAVETHQSGDDTLTNLVVNRDNIKPQDAGGEPYWLRRRAVRYQRFGLAAVLAVQLVTYWLVFSRLSGDAGSQSRFSDASVVLAMVGSFAMTAMLLSKRRFASQVGGGDGSRPINGLQCEPAPLSFSRRLVDVSVAVIALVLTSPLTALAGVAAAATGNRPVIERKLRVGQGGRRIQLLKFRSRNSSSSPVSTWLAAMEHFPRLWNLLRGDLTLVGPKPEPPAVAARYPHDCRWVFRHRPGVIGAVFEDTRQLEGDLDLYLSKVVPAQVNVLCHSLLFNKRLAPRLVSSAAFAMLVFRPGKGPNLGVRPGSEAPIDAEESDASGPPTERYRLERWSLHESAAV